MAASRAPRLSQAQIELRVDKFCQMLMEGVLTWQIVAFCKEEYGIKERQSWEYIRKAQDRIFDSISGQERKQYTATIISSLHNILRKSLADGNMACALGATAQLTKIAGLEPK